MGFGISGRFKWKLGLASGGERGGAMTGFTGWMGLGAMEAVGGLLFMGETTRPGLFTLILRPGNIEFYKLLGSTYTRLTIKDSIHIVFA